MLAKRDSITSPRMLALSKEKRQRRYLWTGIIFFIFVVFVIGFSFLSRVPKFLITEVQVDGTHIVDPQQVKELVTGELSGRYLYLFTKANAFIYPESKIKKDIMHTFPRTETLSIKRIGFHTIVITISERAGSYLWCGASVPEQEGDNCYFVNNDGLIFDVAPYFSGEVYFKFYVAVGDGVASPLEQKVLPPETFKQVIGFMDALEGEGLHPVALVMSDPNAYEFRLARTSIGTTPKILWNSESTLPVVLDNLLTAMKKPEFKNEIISRYNSLMYIDLRFKNKVLYKFNE